MTRMRAARFLWTGRLLALLLGLLAAGVGCSRHANREVVVYCAQDQTFAEPILAEFTRQTGVRARAVFDSEAVKTVGLANRLLSEQAHPQADVFWGNEELRTRQLAARGVFAEPDGWTAFGHRSRRLIVNTNRLALADAPRSLRSLTNAAWRRKVALAYPLFGTTATHFLALRQAWTAPGWEAWCRALAANEPFLVDGNSVVAKLVGRGEAWIGLTDSDDAAAEQAAGGPIAVLPLDADALLIPNTVGVIRNAPHPEAARQLAAYLGGPEVVARLVAGHALEGATLTAGETRTLKPDWPGLLADLDAGTARLKEVFLR